LGHFSSSGGLHKALLLIAEVQFGLLDARSDAILAHQSRSPGWNASAPLILLLGHHEPVNWLVTNHQHSNVVQEQTSCWDGLHGEGDHGIIHIHVLRGIVGWQHAGESIHVAVVGAPAVLHSELQALEDDGHMAKPVEVISILSQVLQSSMVSDQGEGPAPQVVVEVADAKLRSTQLSHSSR